VQYSLPLNHFCLSPCARPEFDLLLFWSLDRLSREGVAATLNHLEKLTSYSVGWRSHTEEYLDSTGLFRDAVIAILATIAKQERIRRSERAKAAIQKLRKQGTVDHLGRPKAVFNRERARELAAQGWSFARIGKQLGVSAMTVFRALR
jgi:DNA invertase Pin-like site-specific DNA recombinase